MADSNSQQPRCSCGFWGSAQTLGLCSKCYKEQQKKMGSDGSNGASNNSCSASASLVADSLQEAMVSEEPMVAEAQASADAACATNGTSDIKVGDEPASDAGDGESSSQGETKPEEPQSSKEQPVPGSKRERQDSESTEPDRPAQKNKKRCHKCNCKLELAIREIGRCRCDYVFCQLHRLPEQHDCIFNHKEKGRQEAREKMVSPKKHVGNSVKRIDSDS